MSETSFRVANFLKMFSMFMVLGSLIYFYAYVDDRFGFINSSNQWYLELSKSVIFYSGLGLFAMLNLLLNIGINVHKSASGYDPKSFLFKSESQKEKVNVALIYLLIGINVMLAMTIIYLAFIRINGMNEMADYIQFPIFGIVVLAAAIVNSSLTLFKK